MIEFDLIKSDGIKKKLLDSSKLFAMGFSLQYSLEDGITSVYEEYKVLLLKVLSYNAENE